MNKKGKELHKLTLRVSADEKRIIEENAATAKKSVNRYLIDTGMASEPVDRAELFRQAQRLVRLQRQIDALSYYGVAGHGRFGQILCGSLSPFEKSAAAKYNAK